MRGWCWIVVAVLAGAQARAAPGNDGAHDEPNDEPHWAALAAPLRAGELELLGGLGGVYSTREGAWPNPTVRLGLGLRRGITDNLQLAFPLLVTLSADLGGLWPRLSLTTGLVGIGYSNVLGAYVQPSVGVGAHFVGDRRLVVVRASISGGRPERRDDRNFFVGGNGGLALRLNDAWSVGMSAGLSQQFDTMSQATRAYAISLGDGPALDNAAVPAVRWLVNDVLSFELWAFASTQYIVADEASFTTVSTVVTATGHFF